MKKFTQSVLVAISLLASMTAMQAFAQTAKPSAATRNAEKREGPKEWHGKWHGKRDGGKDWRGRGSWEGNNEGNDDWHKMNDKHWRETWKRGDGELNDDAGRTAEPINLNTASSAQLRRLPNVGPQTAASIVSHRPYRNLRQFLTVNKRFISSLEWRSIARRVRL